MEQMNTGSDSRIFPCPLTESQKGVYLECINDPSSLKYNIPVLTRLPDGTDAARLRDAVRKVFSLHDALRVNVITPDGIPSMILRDYDAVIPEIETGDAREAFAAFAQPFDLENGPLFRFCIAHASDGDYLFADFHHVIFDGTSIHVFFSQIAEVYDGKAPLPEDLTIFDEAMKEQLPPDPEKRSVYEAYFHEHLDGNYDSRPLSDRMTEGAISGLSISELSSDGFFDFEEAVRFTKENRISENALFLGSFAYALAKFNASAGCSFATIHNGRLDRRLMGAVGMFVRTLPVCLTVDESVSCTDFLRSVYDDYFFLRNNDVISFGELAARYSVSTDVSFIYQSEILKGIPMGNGQLRPDVVQAGAPVAPFTVMMTRKDTYYICHIEFDCGLYTSGQVLSFQRLLMNVIRGMLKAERLSDILLIDTETIEAQDAFNRTEAPWPSDRTPLDLFREQAQAHPDCGCVVYDGKRYTYREVDELTDRLAAYLIKNGIGRETVTGVLIPRCEYMPICALGVLKAGGAYMPLDPGYPAERLNLMVKDSGAKLLIADESLFSLIGEDFTGTRLLTREIPTLPACDTVLPVPAPEDLFVLLYTSGSTGVPKGVMFEHRNTLVTASWMKKYYRIGTDSRVALYASYGFDAHAWDMYSALISGAELHIVPEEIRLDFPALRKYFNENGITHTTMTTQVGRQFSLTGGLDTLKYLTVGGEKLTPFDPPETFTFVNAYGPTEGSIASTYFALDRKYRDIPIGKPLDNLKLYVADSLGRRLPFCAAGELWIAGPHVTRGYLNRPEKTAEAYIKNPFSSEPGYERIYRTGDIVRILPDGNLQFVGRRDSQVKVRGYRIELTEVEEIVRAYPGIKDATAAAFDDPAGGKYIAAYVVSDSEVDTKALSDFIAERKPPYIVPAVIMQIDRIPLNQNQKVNKRALPVPERKAGEIVPPENETQKKILEAAAEILGYDAFGITTSLFEAGLTSIGVLRLNAALAGLFDVPMKISDIRENDTVQKLEAFLASAAPQKEYAVLPDYPVTQTQNGIFIESMAAPDTTVYNIPVLLKLGNGIDLQRLRDAVKKAIDAHPYMKGILFTDANGDIRIRRCDDTEAEVRIFRTEQLPGNDQLLRPFTLLGERLYRAEIYETGDGSYLFFDIHHIVSDGTSEAVLLADIEAAYSGKEPEKETLSGFEAALEEAEVRNSGRYEEARSYWKELLSSCDTECMPKKEPEASSGAGTLRYTASLPAERADAFCEKNGLTLNAFFNAAFSYVLSRFTGRDSVVYATIHNGRSDSRFARSVTMLVKTMPVCAEITKETGTLDFIRGIQKQLVNGMSQDACSFAELAAAFGVSSDVMFAYQGDEMVLDTFLNAPSEMMTVTSETAKVPVSLNVYRNGGRFVFSVEYRKDTYSSSFAFWLGEALNSTALSFLTAEKLDDVTMLSSRAEEALNRMNATGVPLQDLTAVQMIEQAAHKNTGRTAVICDGRSQSFREFNEGANRIAHALIALGVQADDIIGMVLDRSCELLMTEVGIMKAGGAFMPALPDYPEERIDYCLTDSESPFVITSEAIRALHPALFSEGKAYRTLTVEALLNTPDSTDPELSIRPDQLAYCIYTSGSTGKPKGVMLEHRNLSNLAQTFGRSIRFFSKEEAEGSALAECSVSFDASIIEIYPALCTGKTLCMTTDEEYHNPMLLKDLMLKNDVRALTGTPSFLTSMASMPEMQSAYANVESVMVGAEVFPKALYEALRRCSDTMQIINGYGPTECTVCCSSKDLTDGDGITIGGPAGNVQLYVMDSFGHILPPYGAGELIICGAGVGRGYVNLPEKTAASFFTLNGKRAYRSGDFVRLTGKSEIDFTGRIDNQVKLRGFRVELDEIERVICAFEGIRQSKVIVRGEGAQEYLAGFFTADQPVDTEALTAFLKSRLNYYMVPAVLMQLDSMPLTANGKIDKKALPETVQTARRERPRRAAKRSLEQRLCDIFASVLNMDEIYADDNFFELGGTSITASKVTMVLMSDGIEVKYGDIFDNPTPEALAEFIEARSRSTAASSAPETRVIKDQPAALRYNTVKYASEVKREPLGNVLLTGATGFLGIHVLKELLDQEDGHVYCLVRKGNSENAAIRLKTMLIYYFSSGFEDELRDRITVIDADITDPSLSGILADVPFDTVINCAACVKHFSDTDILERINVHGVENLISLCKARNAKLIQISTTSVPGIHTAESFEKNIRMHENELFVIDDMQNKYCISKYHAELRMIEAIDSGLRGKIIRVGNLMGRHSDGEFQVNLETNMFLNGIRGFAAMGMYPISHMTDPMRFSPIDCTARAVVLLAGVNDRFTAFNCDNRYGFDEMKLIDSCNRCGIPIEAAEDEIYYAEYHKKLGDDRINARLTGLAAYDIRDAHAVETDNLFTTNILYRIGFSWPLVDDAYLDRAITSIMTLDYFDLENPEEES